MLSEGGYTAEFLVSECPGKISRDTVTVTVPASTTLEAGAVLAKLSATGKHVEYDNAGSDGSEAAAAILYSKLVNDSGSPVDMDGVVVNFGAEVAEDLLVWKSGLVDADKDAGKADLLNVGIKVRTTVGE